MWRKICYRLEEMKKIVVRLFELFESLCRAESNQTKPKLTQMNYLVIPLFKCARDVINRIVLNLCYPNLNVISILGKNKLELNSNLLLAMRE